MADRRRKKGQTSKLTLPWQLPRVVKRVALASVILVIILLLVGGFYTYFTYQHQLTNPTKDTTAAQTGYRAIKPVIPGPNTTVGAAIEELTTPVYSGSTATAAVTTAPQAKCAISLIVNSVSSPSLALEPQTADDYGTVSWSWVVTNTTPTGTWPLKVTCVRGSKSGMVEGNITITAPPSSS